MLELLRIVWNTRRNRTASQRPTVRPRLEELEGRALPSGFMSGIQHTLANLNSDVTRHAVQRPAVVGQAHDLARGHEDHDEGGAFGAFGRTLAQGRNINSVLDDLNSDVTSLTTALGSGASSTVSGDLKTIQTDLTTLSKDIAAGTSISKDVSTLVTDEGTLVTDLGTGLSSDVQHQLNHLTRDVMDVSSDVTQFTNGLNTQLTTVQNDLTKLTGQLGTLSGAAATDLTALEKAVTTLASDVSAGNSITSDVTTVLKDEQTLITDLGTPLPAGSQNTLLLLARDVAGLGISSIL